MCTLASGESIEEYSYPGANRASNIHETISIDFSFAATAKQLN